MKLRILNRLLFVTLNFPVAHFAAQPSSAPPVSAPLRDLPWSPQLNFLHTTETHGWHAGHLQEYGAFSQRRSPCADFDLGPPLAPTGVIIFP